MGGDYPLLITPQSLPRSLQTKGGAEEATESGLGVVEESRTCWLRPLPAACQAKACVLLF